VALLFTGGRRAVGIRDDLGQLFQGVDIQW
jgi:hypothetical protein